MIAAIYARKSTDDSDRSEDARSATRHIEPPTATLVLVSVLLLTAGCTTTWTKQAGFTEQDFYRDDYHCRVETAHVRGIGPDLRDYKWWLYDRCMMGKGYVKE